MSRARPVFKGATLFITRRVHGRQFRLRPSRKTDRIILYVLGVLAHRYSVHVHAICVMSDHYHLALTDPHGHIVELTRDFHALVARHLNAAHGDFESLWSRAQTNHVALAQGGDLIDKIVYTLANPVAAYLVRHGRSWPGVRMAWPARAKTIERPRGFFRGQEDGGCWPRAVDFELHRPPGHDELSNEELAATIATAYDAREKEIQRFADKNGIKFLGARAVRRMSRYASARSREERFDIVPTLACKDPALRIERLRERRAWLEAYVEALEAWRAGDRAAVFPPGTYKMRVVHNATVASAPT